MPDKPTFGSLRANIRHVVDHAPAQLFGREIFSRLSWRTTLENFWVTLGQMVDDRQLVRGDAPQSTDSRAKFVYGPGPVMVDPAKEYRVDRGRGLKGFMAMKREREAKARGRG